NRVLSVLGHRGRSAVGDGAFIASVRGSNVAHRLVGEDRAASGVLERERYRCVIDERSAAGIRQGVQANDVVRANADDFDHGGEWVSGSRHTPCAVISATARGACLLHYLQQIVVAFAISASNPLTVADRLSKTRFGLAF